MPKLTRAQREFLSMAAEYPVDRREVLTRQQWDVFGRLEAMGLVTRCVFIARITDAGRAALQQKDQA
jgi:hypothetical protein